MLRCLIQKPFIIEQLPSVLTAGAGLLEHGAAGISWCRLCRRISGRRRGRSPSVLSRPDPSLLGKEQKIGLFGVCNDKNCDVDVFGFLTFVGIRLVHLNRCELNAVRRLKVLILLLLVTGMLQGLGWNCSCTGCQSSHTLRAVKSVAVTFIGTLFNLYGHEICLNRFSLKPRENIRYPAARVQIKRLRTDHQQDHFPDADNLLSPVWKGTDSGKTISLCCCSGVLRV